MSPSKLKLGGARTRREQALLTLLAVFVVLAFGAVVLARLAGDDEDIDASPRPTRPAVTSPTASPQATASPTAPPVLPPTTIENFEGRDPFQPLVVPPPPPAGSGDGVGSGTGTSGGATGDGGGGGDGGGSGDGSASTRDRVTLHEVFRQNGELMARVGVNDTEYVVGEGDAFADSYRVIDLTADCGTFARGDERFELCTGEDVLK